MTQQVAIGNGNQLRTDNPYTHAVNRLIGAVFLLVRYFDWYEISKNCKSVLIKTVLIFFKSRETPPVKLSKN